LLAALTAATARADKEKCQVRQNRTKRLLRANDAALGLSLTIAEPFVAEVVGPADFDFILRARSQRHTIRSPDGVASARAGRPGWKVVEPNTFDGLTMRSP
jgi:hypothetical protein